MLYTLIIKTQEKTITQSQSTPNYEAEFYSYVTHSWKYIPIDNAMLMVNRYLEAGDYVAIEIALVQEEPPF